MSKKTVVYNVETVNIDEKYGVFAGPIFGAVCVLCFVAAVFVVSLIFRACSVPQ